MDSQNKIMHNHKPCYGLVKNCLYCQQYGNFFEKGPVKYDPKLHNINMISFKEENKNNLIKKCVE